MDALIPQAEACGQGAMHSHRVALDRSVCANNTSGYDLYQGRNAC